MKDHYFFIKNGSHNTIYTYKNYFATVFSVSVFSFSKNKLNPNTPIVEAWMFLLESIEVGSKMMKISFFEGE